jgi:hypothetical protein
MFLLDHGTGCDAFLKPATYYQHTDDIVRQKVDFQLDFMKKKDYGTVRNCHTHFFDPEYDEMDVLDVFG